MYTLEEGGLVALGLKVALAEARAHGFSILAIRLRSWLRHRFDRSEEFFFGLCKRYHTHIERIARDPSTLNPTPYKFVN